MPALSHALLLKMQRRTLRRLLAISTAVLLFGGSPFLRASAPPAFTSASSATFPQGIQGSFTITTSGQPAPTIMVSGRLPGGVKFVDNGDGTASLLGIPGNGLGLVGDYSLTFTATNGVSPAATQNFTLTVTRPPLITSVKNATFVVGAANTFTVTTRNSHPKSTITMTGTLPAGVTFAPQSNGTAILSGTPGAGSQGIYFLTFTATNGTPPPSIQVFTLTVTSTAPVTHAPIITSAASTTFTVGTEGTFTIRTTGTPTSSILFSGTQPPWLSFTDNTDGTATLVGIPDTGSAGSYSFTITATNGIAPDAVQTFTLNVNGPPPVFATANNTTFIVGTSGTFTIRTNPPSPAATISANGSLPSGINFSANTDGTATISGIPATGSEGTYPISLHASNGTLPDATQNFTVSVQDAPPVTQAPAITSANSTRFTVGTLGTFTVTATGIPTPSFTLAGAQPTWLSFVDNGDGTATFSGTPDADSNLTYTFTIIALDGVAPDATQDFTLEVTPVPAAARLVNISTRLLVQTGDGVGIGGFIISGTDTKTVLIRAIGPTLSIFGLGNVLQDTVLELHDSSGATLVANDDWKIPQQADIQATGLAPPDDRESALLLTLQPGSYTVIMSGKNNTSGLALVEVYDVDSTAASQLTNISTRGFVQTGDNVMIGGFIVSGASGSANVVVRALGPSLSVFGLNNLLPDPTLSLYDSNGTPIQFDNDWKDSQQTQIQNTGLQPPNDFDSAIAITLAPGAYTAIVQGNNGGTGVALVDVYYQP